MKRCVWFFGAAVLASVGALGAAIIVDFRPRLVWNGSASAPLGLYLIKDLNPRLGEFVLVAPRQRIRDYIEERGYAPTGAPLIKRAAALAGDEVCRDGARISINNVIVGYALNKDAAGRPMPRWNGCVTLRRGEIFLLNDHLQSLDGRYFGATARAEIIGVARPLWTYEKR